jgi:hypothetical protein
VGHSQWHELLLYKRLLSAKEKLLPRFTREILFPSSTFGAQLFAFFAMSSCEAFETNNTPPPEGILVTREIKLVRLSNLFLKPITHLLDL